MDEVPIRDESRQRGWVAAASKLEKLELELEIPRVMSRSLSLLVSCTGFMSITEVFADNGATDEALVVMCETG